MFFFLIALFFVFLFNLMHFSIKIYILCSFSFELFLENSIFNIYPKLLPHMSSYLKAIEKIGFFLFCLICSEYIFFFFFVFFSNAFLH